LEFNIRRYFLSSFSLDPSTRDLELENDSLLLDCERFLEEITSSSATQQLQPSTPQPASTPPIQTSNILTEFTKFRAKEGLYKRN